MPITTGTPEAHGVHSVPLATLGLTLGAGIPALILLVGVAALGFDAIAWGGAILWGVVAALVHALVQMAIRALGATRLDLFELLGSAVAQPQSSAARTAGGVIHLVVGAVLAVAWAYGCALAEIPATWRAGLVWGLGVGALALALYSSLGVAHPRVRRGAEDDPGIGGTNFGAATPLALLAGHAAYGIVLGLLYAAAPLA